MTNASQSALAPRTRPETRIFYTHVSDVQRLNPHMMRITLAGGDLGSYVSAGPDSFIYVFFPRTGDDTRHAIERDFTWGYWSTLPEEQRQVGRYYTVRSFDPGANAIDIDVVIHGDGPGSTWAETRAKRDQAVAFWGPRTAYDPPASTCHFCLVGDETALPAIGAILEELPSNAIADVVVEIPDGSATVQLQSGASITVQWLPRNGAPAGRTDALIRAVRSLSLPESSYVWGGGEFETMKTIKADVVEVRGLQPEQVSLVGYWRHR